jgi:hypothetical protein
MNIDGNINSISAGFEPTLKPIEFARKEKEVPISAESLQKYTGEYELSGVTAKVYIKNTTLYLYVPGQPDYELASLGNDKFTIKSLTGFSVQFEKDDKGNVIAVSFIQPNGTFKATKKK